MVSCLKQAPFSRKSLNSFTSMFWTFTVISNIILVYLLKLVGVACAETINYSKSPKATYGVLKQILLLQVKCKTYMIQCNTA